MSGASEAQQGTGESATTEPAAETPPAEGAVKAKDGNWYVRKPDGWYKVE